ncbi:MAG: hypothetical protein K0R00_63 [Herbinix sp.]|jgi:hypothetical protein|nr:hypothetical protein [Herbinix sp.]
MAISDKEIAFVAMNGIALTVMGLITAYTTKRLSEEKIKNIKKGQEVETLKTNLNKMEDFMEWEISYMEDKINLNMIQLRSVDMYRFAERELKEIKGVTEVYAKEELLAGIRQRVNTIRTLLNSDEEATK